ncbi:MAG: alpha/beta hydrolase [Acidimicrobiia bacterium]
MSNSRLSKFLGMGAVFLAAAVLMAACATNTDTAGSSTSSQSDPVTTVVATATTQPGPVTTLAATTTTTQPAPTTTIDAKTKVTVVEGEPYRQPNDGDPSTVDIYLTDTSPGRPTVVLLHGWGFPGTVGPDLDLSPLAEEIARLGSTVFYFGWDTNGGFSADSAADLSCIGGFVGARAAEYGSDPESVIVVGHSMGGETGSMLALNSFGLTPSPDCVETGKAPTPYAFLGIAGNYGMLAQPLDDDLNTFRVRAQPVDQIREIAAGEFVKPGLTALQAYELTGYSTLPVPNPPRMVLLVGSEDQYSVTDADITAAFAEALKAYGTDVEVVEVADANHNNVIYPDTDAGQATLQVISDILNNRP